MKTINMSLFAIISSILAACGGGGGGSSPSVATTPPPVQNAVATGVWKTSYAVTTGANAGDTINAFVMISPSNQYFSAGINANNHCATVGFGQAAVSGNTFSGTGNDVVVQFSNLPTVNTNCSFPDGSTNATGTVTGSLTSGTSLAVNGTATTSLGLALQGQTVTYNFDTAISSVPPSLATVSGNYLSSDGSTVTVSSTGAISESNITSGCTVSGQLSIPSSSSNIYNINISFSSCAAGYTALNGLSLAGLATYDTTVSPNALIVGLSGNVGNGYIAYLDFLSR